MAMNLKTGELRYFYSSRNNHNFLEKPMLVENENGIEREYVGTLEYVFLEHAKQQRPNSNFVVRNVTNATFYVSKLIAHPIGANGTSRHLNLCFFCCLALHKGGEKLSLDKTAKSLLERYLRHVGKTRDEFKGVTLNELRDME